MRRRERPRRPAAAAAALDGARPGRVGSTRPTGERPGRRPHGDRHPGKGTGFLRGLAGWIDRLNDAVGRGVRLLTLLMVLVYPTAFTIGGTALAFGLYAFGLDFFNLLPLRVWGIMTNITLTAVPLFIFMGVMLERSRLAEDLLETMGLVLGPLPGGIALSVVMVGTLLAATTGIVGATVTTMGLISLPTMVRRGYRFAERTRCSGLPRRQA